MKQLYTNCVLNAATKSIVVNDKVILLEDLLLIVNATRGSVYYNFASGPRVTRQTLPAPAGGGADTKIFIDGSIDLSGHESEDKILIFYDDGLSNSEVKLTPGGPVGSEGGPADGVGVRVGVNLDGEFTTVEDSNPFPVKIQNEGTITQAIKNYAEDPEFYLPVAIQDVRLEGSSDYIKVSGFPAGFNVFNGIYQRINTITPSATSNGANLVSYTNISAVGLGGEFCPRLDYAVTAQAWPPDSSTPAVRKWFFSAEEVVAEKTYPVSNWTGEESSSLWLGSVSPIGITGWTWAGTWYPGDFSNISITSHAPITTRDPALGSRWEGISGSDIPSQSNQPPTVLGLLQRICYRFTQIFGNPNTSASSSDTDINATIISLFKRLLQRITTLVAPIGSRITGMGSSASRVLVEEVDKAGANYRTIQITAGPRYTGIFRSVSPGGQGWIESGDGFFYNMLGSDGSDGWDVVLQYGTGTGFSGSRWHLYDNARALPVFWANNNTASLPLVISTSGWTRNTTFIPLTEPLSVSPVVAQPVVIQPQAYNNPIPVIETNEKGSTVSNGTFTSTSSLQVVGNNSNRKLCTIFNEGPGNLFVLYGGGTASSSNYSVRLAPRDYLEVDKFTGQITAVFDLSGSMARTTSIS